MSRPRKPAVITKAPARKAPPLALPPRPTYPKALRRDASELAKIQARSSTDLDVTIDGRPSSALKDVYTRIETGFKFSGDPLDSDFLELHVEPLLDQAADLLDRGVRDRAAYDDIA